MKKFEQKNCRKMFLEAIFFAFEKTFSDFPYKIFVTALHDIIGLQNFSLSFCQSLSRITMCNLHWCYTFCTGVTLFALVLHLNCTALSQSESSICFMCIIRSDIIRVISKSNERAARVRFEITSMISDQTCTTRSSITTLLDPFLNRTILIA